MIKYLGSKRLLCALISRLVQEHTDKGCVLDLFSGTGRVSRQLRADGFTVRANDISAYAATLASCFLRATPAHMRQLQPVLDELNALPGEPGFFHDTYAVRSRFFSQENAARIDSIRAAINAYTGIERDILLTSLMLAADRVDSTCGVQMAYLKQYAPRAYNKLTLTMPEVLFPAENADVAKGLHSVSMLDAAQAAKEQARFADVVYADPPYNQHSYLGNYHIWETLVLNDQPEVYGVACKRVDVRERKSPFNSKIEATSALVHTVDSLSQTDSRVRTIIISLNEGSYANHDAVKQALRDNGYAVRTVQADHPAYIGYQIGVYNQNGEKVGQQGKSTTVESFIVGSR